jgi:hypothetical protein
MRSGWIAGIVAAVGLSLAFTPDASAQQMQNPYYPSYVLHPSYYYPHHYFPHNYWPAMSPRWPERPGMPYQPPPAYQAYPPFRQPGWRYEMWQPQKYYRGHHFWLDQI